MPRDGSDVYTQPFPDVVADTTVESAVYNGFVADIAQDLNTPRPIVAGGTDAANADEARFNLSTGVATQVVTNYDSHVFWPGGFRSAASATNPPVASHAFAGVAYINEPLAYPATNANVVVQARDLDDTATPGAVWVREKKAGVWSAWTAELADTGTALDGKVDIAGDTMTGHLGLPVGPAAANAVRKDYVDAADTALTAAVALKADIASPTFTGDPKAPTPTAGDNDTSIATTAFVTAATSALLATAAEARAATDNTRAISPLTHKQAHTPAFYGVRNAQAISPATATAVVSWTEVLDTDNCFPTGGSSSRFTPNVAGWYYISGTVNIPTAGSNRYVAIAKNGAITNHSTNVSGGPTATNALNVSAMIFFNGTTDFVELFALTDFSGGNINQADFSGFRLFPT